MAGVMLLQSNLLNVMKDSLSTKTISTFLEMKMYT